jgi:hypothetical protein
VRHGRCSFSSCHGGACSSSSSRHGGACCSSRMSCPATAPRREAATLPSLQATTSPAPPPATALWRPRRPPESNAGPALPTSQVEPEERCEVEEPELASRGPGAGAQVRPWQPHRAARARQPHRASATLRGWHLGSPTARRELGHGGPGGRGRAVGFLYSARAMAEVDLGGRHPHRLAPPPTGATSCSTRRPPCSAPATAAMR